MSATIIAIVLLFNLGTEEAQAAPADAEICAQLDVDACADVLRERWRHRGALGAQLSKVKRAEGAGGFEIAQVLPASPASDAGIKAGDVLLRIGGESLVSYEQTTARIAEIVAGEQVELTLERNGEPWTAKLIASKAPAQVLEGWILYYVYTHFPQEAFQVYYDGFMTRQGSEPRP